MSMPVAGTSKKSLFSQQDYLAPLAIPTGESAVDMVNIIWRKNEVHLDVGSYSLGAGIIVMWPMLLIFIYVAQSTNNSDVYWLGACILTIPILILIYSLFQPTPLPIRFNRQRREVCVPRENGNYWIVPWETVAAISSEHSTVSQVGRHSTGMLFISFDNPDPHAEESNKHVFWGFNCGSSEGAMAQWECMRSYMEIGPQVVKDNSARFHHPKGILATYVDSLFIAAERKGWFMTLVWEGFCGIFIFNTFLIDALERLKLYPLPEFSSPDIIEWSKPLPPERWAKRSPELELAIAAREAQLADCTA
ncbi:DUF6708 domain-containing protein [Pseudomonas psychrophila]|uniref:DUF6708 domain-containing protein n=1 Tax=Pseudomonas psychrophila TaxID=122355 RepID=UPI000316C476|nr:DUF6708 domain-containing protein [Pseudomonas psychrophila]